eukprot:CAMPEP_0202966616 /NCGR_PEP_ID=MMETSP1396-20130829/11130_1 /ASSEMBLY_ACC=CAM_ASM_000872 /TAXON_ID= /ORGANISM="Pseudokeronopsis sp., Strain Brazil" /LENGTH=35 /DNA_ID= /DNA_START= /DNA_END= /DNA_ORIENTATION=
MKSLSFDVEDKNYIVKKLAGVANCPPEYVKFATCA